MNTKQTLRLSILLVAALVSPSAGALAQQQPPPGMVFKFDRQPQDITFTNGAVRLSGVLVEPEGQRPFPAVILVHGAGPATHDEPAFVVHANAFLKQGFAVVAYDKRGSGNSTGNLEVSDYDDLAGDVTAAVAFLRTRNEIAKSKIGLLGRSEGAWVSAIAASHDPEIAFVILSSGSAVGPYEQTVFYTRRALRAKGLPEDRIEKAVNVKTSIWEFYRNVAGGKTSPQVLRAERDSLLKRLSEFQQFHPELPEGIMDPELEDRRKFSAFSRMIFYAPQPSLKSVRVPLLEAIGANDEVVDPATTVDSLERLHASGRDVTVKVFPRVGHSLLKMQGTTILGYADGYLDFIVSWARGRVEEK